MKNLFVSLIIFSSYSVWGFVISKSDSGNDIKWKKFGDEVVLYYDTTPKKVDVTLDIDESQLVISKSEYIKNRVESILMDSVAQWNPNGKFKVKLIENTALPSVGSGENTFRFSQDKRYFGSGVIGVTTLSFGVDGGEISSADILINQATSVTQLTLDKSISSNVHAYLGDVFTHELGHFLGLAHSETIGSSMIYSIFKGQHIASSDDLSGAMANYNVINSDESISGEVITGKDLNTTFGVNVNLISVDQNKIVQSVVSKSDGTFSFKNLNQDESYIISLTPLKNLETLPSYYQNVNAKLCGMDNFKTSFFSKCGVRSKGRPQIIRLNNESSIDIGSLTIKCDEGLNPVYLSKKYKDTEREFSLLNYYETSSIFYGHFSDSEINSGLLGKGDAFQLDLRNLNTNGKSLSSLIFRLGVMSSGLGSVFDTRIAVKRVDQNSWKTYSSDLSDTGKVITDRTIDFSLSSDASNNLFDLIVYPVKLSEVEQYEIFSVTNSSSRALTNSSNLYLLSTSVGSLDSGHFSALNPLDSYPYSDNEICPEGQIVYSSRPFTSSSTNNDASQSGDNSTIPIGCGTIDIDSNPSGGFGSVIIGLFGFLLLFALHSNTRKLCRKLDF